MTHSDNPNYTEEEIQAMCIEAEERDTATLKALSPFYDHKSTEPLIYVLSQAKLKRERSRVAKCYDCATNHVAKNYWEAYMNGLDLVVALSTPVRI